MGGGPAAPGDASPPITPDNAEYLEVKDLRSVLKPRKSPFCATNNAGAGFGEPPFGEAGSPCCPGMGGLVVIIT